MAVGIQEMAITVVVFGLKSFTYGIAAENTKPASGAPIQQAGVTVCKYPTDPSVVLGFLSIASLAASVLVGFISVFYPYGGKSVPRRALFKSTALFVYFITTLLLSLFAGGMLIWVTITEVHHLKNNVHENTDTKCPTAKSGLFGGAAFLALDASLFWLICLMLTRNAREDYFDEEFHKGDYGQVPTADYNAKGQSKI